MDSNTRKEDNALEEALSPIVNKLIDKNYETSQDKIAVQMAPLIGSAIREQIKSQKDDVVDALYPVIGNMISRYVTKTLEDMLTKINSQIQNGLSFATIKRKLIARLKGVSESELLLNENASANIRALLLIHKETGIVLAHSENPKHPVSEPEMIASMMTAIRSFVNDWIEQNSVHHELGEIDFGGNKIIIEASGYSYLAVIVEGAAYKSTYDMIRTTLEYIVLHHGDSIREFDGNHSNFPNLEIYKEISMLLSTNKKELEQKKKIHPLIFIVPFIFLALGGYSYYKNYLDNAIIQTINTKFYKTPQLTSYRLDVKIDDGVIVLSGEVPFEYHKQLSYSLATKATHDRKIQNNIIVINSYIDPMQVSSNIAHLIRGLNTQDGINISYTYNLTTLTLTGSLWGSSLEKKVLTEIKTIAGIQNITNNIKIILPTLSKTIYFKRNFSTLTQAAQTTLIETISLLQKLDNNVTIKLSSYSDLIGSKAHNQVLSKKRIAKTSTFLRRQGKITNNIVTVIYNKLPKNIDLTDDPQKARCITITYQKKNYDDI